MSYRLKALLALASLAAGSGPVSAQRSNAPAAPLRAEIIQPDRDENLQDAAWVVQLDALRNQGDQTVKLFGTAGGDPAMNGLYTYLAFFGSPHEGWRIFRLGDFLTYRVLSASRGRLALEIRESVMDAETGSIGTRVRRLTVSWTPGREGEPPASVRVTAAR